MGHTSLVSNVTSRLRASIDFTLAYSISLECSISEQADPLTRVSFYERICSTLGLRRYQPRQNPKPSVPFSINGWYLLWKLQGFGLFFSITHTSSMSRILKDLQNKPPTLFSISDGREFSSFSWIDSNDLHYCTSPYHLCHGLIILLHLLSFLTRLR